MSAFTVYATRWRKHAADIARSRYFADRTRAHDFVVRHVVAAWLPVLGVADDANVLKRFRVTPTQERILHFFGRGVLGLHSAGTRAPRVQVWPPSSMRDAGGAPVCVRAIPVGDIARIVGASHSAVDEALRRFKRRGGGDDLCDRGLCNVLSFESGVYLDGVFDRQTQFPFALTQGEYAHARRFAHEKRVEVSTFVARQHAWCAQAREAHRDRGSSGQLALVA